MHIHCHFRILSIILACIQKNVSVYELLNLNSLCIRIWVLKNVPLFCRYHSPDTVNILLKGGKQEYIASEENENPLYDSEEKHTYCTIDDMQNQYKKEIGLATKPSQSNLYEVPVDPEASTSSFNPIYTGINAAYDVSPLTHPDSVNKRPKNNNNEIPSDPGASRSASDPPCSNDSGSIFTETDRPLIPTIDTTPESHYKSPGNPYDTMIPNTNTPRDVASTNSVNQPAHNSYENVPNNNSHYQTPRDNPDKDVYEVMHGRDSQLDVLENTGMNQC